MRYINGDEEKALKMAFEAGKHRGVEEMYGSARAYEDEIDVPDFEEWLEENFNEIAEALRFQAPKAEEV